MPTGTPSTSPDSGHEQTVPPWHRIYVGILRNVSPHPHADREVVVEVDAGWGRLTVVTGGPRVAVGHKVALAIHVLDPNAPVGMPLIAWLGVNHAQVPAS